MKYNVPLLNQSVSPICWVVSAAMIQKYWQQKTGGTFDTTLLTGGVSPDNSCIPGSSSYASFLQGLRNAGFQGIPKPAHTLRTGELSSLLRQYGPLLLDHECLNFNYGSPYGKITPASTTKGGAYETLATAAHAVVITGVNGNVAFFNNPWGYKDVHIPSSDLIASINQAYTHGRVTLAFPIASPLPGNVVN